MAESNPFFEKYRDRRWQEKRLRIMNRAGFRCEMCGSDDNKSQLHIHHGYYEGRGVDPWDYPDDTLWCICAECHELAGSLKHDCHIELARINPAFLRIVFEMIRAFRAGQWIIDDEEDRDKLSIGQQISPCCWIDATMFGEFGPNLGATFTNRILEEAQCQSSSK